MAYLYSLCGIASIILGGVNNNLAYLLAVEKLAGIEVPERAQVIRVMMCELFRIASHLVWYGTFAQDLGQLSPVFYMFSDRERIFDIVEAKFAAAACIPTGSASVALRRICPKDETLVKSFVDYFPKRLREYDSMVMRNSSSFKARTVGIGIFIKEEAIEWGCYRSWSPCLRYGVGLPQDAALFGL